MLKEKKCPYCKAFFYYEDRVDEECSDEGRNSGFCPKCVDPHHIPGEAYEKTTIIGLFRKHLKKNGVVIDMFDLDQTIELMKEFPTAYNLWLSNGSFRTFNLLTGTLFEGDSGRFEIGPLKDSGSTYQNRYIICCRCKTPTTYSKNDVLTFFMGLEKKRCLKCDRDKNDKNLSKNGRPSSEFSERSIARALNVSRNDLRRHKISKPNNPLPLGTVVNGLIIVDAFWDNESESPKYRFKCPKCNNIFRCLQKHINDQLHICKG